MLNEINNILLKDYWRKRLVKIKILHLEGSFDVLGEKKKKRIYPPWHMHESSVNTVSEENPFILNFISKCWYHHSHNRLGYFNCFTKISAFFYCLNLVFYIKITFSLCFYEAIINLCCKYKKITNKPKNIFRK